MDMEVDAKESDLEVDSRPIAERKHSRVKILPRRYRDDLPEPNAGLITTEEPEPESEPQQRASPQPSTLMKIHSQVRNLFKSPRNIFGLFRVYLAYGMPDHDPEQSTSLGDLIEPPILAPLEFGPSFGESVASTSSGSMQNFHPYPNRSSFLLGNWYWCDGVQKSQQSFKNLVDIIRDPSFNTADIQDTKWTKINAALVDAAPTITGPTACDAEVEWEWEDEESGWVKTPVTIGVPFTQRARHPGPKNYTIPGFYHRSIVSVIKEKLRNSNNHQYFHYEPFELQWVPRGGILGGRVYGEVYSSPEFIEVHNKLQEPRPGEQDCTLPKVVLALMFWSDATHLTSFGKAQLWPLYMGFGNESKYRRCRPSLHLLNHVAYFEKVRLFHFLYN